MNFSTVHDLVLAAREACTNALRHSGASEVSLHVSGAAARILIIVSDNGCGFDPSAVSGETEGLAGMARRLSAVRGRCLIESSPGHGTRIRLEWPCAG